MSWTLGPLHVHPAGWTAVIAGDEVPVVAWVRARRADGVRLVVGLVADGVDLLPAPSVPGFLGYRPGPVAEVQARAPELPPVDLCEALDRSDLEADESTRHDELWRLLRLAEAGEWAGSALRALESRRAGQSAQEAAILGSARWRALAHVAVAERAGAEFDAWRVVADLAARAPGAQTYAEALGVLGVTNDEWTAAAGLGWPPATTTEDRT